MSSRDEWRITSASIELEMERIAGLLQKSVHFQSRTSAPHPLRQRHETEPAPVLTVDRTVERTLDLTPEFVSQR
jgi:hypothetical protein